MKKIKFTGIFLLALCYVTCLSAQDRLTVPLSKPGQPYQLSLNLVQGSITVSSYEGTEVVIEYGNVKAGAGPVYGMYKLTAGNMSGISADENNNRISIRASDPSKVSNLTIRVPQRITSLKLSSINSGIITVNDVNTEIEVNNTNGTIRLNNVGGSAVASTVNGSILGNFKSVDPNAAMAFSSLNGTVNIVFPAGIKANMKLKTDQGNISTDFDMKVLTTGKTNITTEANGLIRIKSPDWLNGTLNGGGPEIMMKTTNGSILIRKEK